MKLSMEIQKSSWKREVCFTNMSLFLKRLNGTNDDTMHNTIINIQRSSMKAIVLLFTKKTVTDSEEFVNPKIKSVKVTIAGTPNLIYSQGIPRKRLLEEARTMKILR